MKEKRLSFNRQYTFDHVTELKVLSYMVREAENRTLISMLLSESDFHKREHKVAFRILTTAPANVTDGYQLRGLLKTESGEDLEELADDLRSCTVYELPTALELALRLRDLSFFRLLKEEEREWYEELALMDLAEISEEYES